MDTLSRPIADANVELVGSGIHAISLTSGSFALRDVPPGLQVLRVRALGYQPLLASINVIAGRTHSFEIELSRVPMVLDTVSIIASQGLAKRYQGMVGMEEFFRRSQRGVGTFMTREALARLPSGSAATLLRTVPGIAVHLDVAGRSSVVSNRCGRIEDVPSDTGSRPVDGMLGGAQRIAVVVDGMRIPFSPIETLAQLSTDDIEAVEIYSGSSQLPAELMGNACMAIVIHTRR